jgi:antitoxin (DNA-binding transcriptional repressor) of toxin-antitoxin stability system
MQTISATELARNTREVLDRVVTGGEVVAIERNHALIAQIGPADCAGQKPWL